MMAGRRRAAAAAAVVIVVTLGGPAGAEAGGQRPGRTEHVSVGPDRGYMEPSISADGRLVAYRAGDIFIRDRLTGDARRLTRHAVDGHSTHPAITADGSAVAFTSDAPTLVPGDTNARKDVFLVDVAGGVVERVSVSTGGAQANGDAAIATPAVSLDGRFVAFTSSASNLVSGDTNGTWDVFVRDRARRTTERVSVSSDGAQADLGVEATRPAISADGRFVAFTSNATNLAGRDTNATFDVFVRDRVLGVTELVSVTAAGAQGDGYSGQPVLSGDGQFVAFVSAAKNLVPADTSGVPLALAPVQVFVRDRVGGLTERVSVASDGMQAAYAHSVNPTWAASYDPAISADGRYVAFASAATNLSPGIGNRVADVFVHDRATRATERVSVASDGTESDYYSWEPAISADGRHVAFETLATNLVPPETPCLRSRNCPEVLVRDRGPAVGVGGIAVRRAGDAALLDGWATFSGTTVADVADTPGDAPAAALLGADLTRARLVVRYEQQDLLARLDVAELPSAAPHAGGGGLPGVVYVVGFAVARTEWEVRVLRPARAGPAPDASLWRCDGGGCSHVATIGASVGSTGLEVLAAVPLAALGVAEGAVLSDARASTAAGDTGRGAVAPIDTVALGNLRVPLRSLRVSVDDVSVGEEEAAFDVVVPPAATFTAALDVRDRPPGTYAFRARACLDAECGTASAVIPLP